MRPNRFFAVAAVVFSIAGVVALFFDYRVALLAFAAAAMFGVYLWLLRRRYGPGSLDMTAERPEDVNIGWMRTVGWILPAVGIVLMVTGNQGWGALVFVVALVFLIGSMALSPTFRQAWKDQVAQSKAKYEEEQRQKEE